MTKKISSNNKFAILGAIVVGIIFSVAALAPQINLWLVRGTDWNGVYALNEFDEPAYAAYIQSLIDGKPRRNSPYSGATDSPENPQKESLFSIQFLASYPTALAAKLFGVSSSTAMIFLGAFSGFMAAFILYWLFYLFSQNAAVAFVGTVSVLFGGAIAAGQGSIISIISPESVDYNLSLMFTRRSNPAISFPIMFLFFIFVWKFFTHSHCRKKILSGVLAIFCFTFIVYAYFFHWTTILAWFCGLLLLWGIFRFEDFRKELLYLTSFAICLFLVLIPYFILLSNRSEMMDSVQLLNITHEPDLWRIPELLSYLAIALILLAVKFKQLVLNDKKTVFLLSFAFVAPVVFNQQILTGRSLQPFHYEFFCANYISLFALLMTGFTILQKKTDFQMLSKVLLLFGTIVILIGYFDTTFGISILEKQNIHRDELMAVAQKIKSVENFSSNRSSVVLSFDSDKNIWTNSIDLPALSSQPVLWSPHLSMFAGISAKENIHRIFQSLYYQNFDKERLKAELQKKDGSLSLGLFGGERILPIMSKDFKPVTEEEINEVVEKYDEFRRNFSTADAASPALSFVLVHKDAPNDFSALDRWYERNEGEEIGKFVLFRVKLRTL
jgi:hypothetical protein